MKRDFNNDSDGGNFFYDDITGPNGPSFISSPLDSDDKLESGAISHLVVALNTEIAKNNDVDVVLGNSYLCKAGKPSMAFMTDEAFFIDNSEEIALRKLLNRELRP